MFDYGNGGAFPEIHVPQYPRGMGLNVHVGTPALASSEIRTQSISSTLLVKYVNAAELAKPQQQAVDELTTETRQQLQKKLEDLTANVGNKSQRHDVLDPRLQKKSQQVKPLDGSVVGTSTTIATYDPQPIVRSPPKKPRNAPEDEALASVPFCVSSWTNKKNIIVALEDRMQQEHVEEAPMLAAQHIDVAAALRSAREDVRRQHELQDRAAQAAHQIEQAALEAKAFEEAQALLRNMEQSRGEDRESKEERRERLRLEREHREREREAKAKIRRRENVAARIGITLEALEADTALLRSVDDTAAQISDDVALMVDSRVLQAARGGEDRGDHSADSGASTATSSTITARETTVSTRGIEQHMVALATVAAASETVAFITHDSEDEDDDIFAIKDVLQRKRHRTD